MENTIENKARFFALYFNQDVRVWKERPDSLCNVGYAALSKEALLYSHLLLTPLSAITDEDAIEVAKIITNSRFRNENYKIRRSVQDVTIINDGYLNQVIINFEDCYCSLFHTMAGYRYNPNSLSATDYLRSRGYALPYLDATVEDLVQMGWVKLKTIKNEN